MVRRRRELWLRLALGATRSGIVRLIVRESLVVTVAGVVLGAPLALALGRALKTLLFGSSGMDAIALIVAVVLLVAIGVAASLLPAQRATRIEPADALRCD